MIATPPNQPGRWESPLLALPAAGASYNVTATHGRGAVPLHVEWVLVNLQTEAEFVPGDEVLLISGPNATFNPTVWKSAAQTGMTFNGALALQHYAKNSVAATNLTNTKWALKVYCNW